ncbi:MAG: cellulase family glycosylhydrolase [Oscillospiraceae bacterium]|jgi:endoglycosylceramidase|nr:cellulase family glycosylhydrolase [Oscillospiraceae bacterium]
MELIKAQGKRFLDASNRERIFRGINIGEKNAPKELKKGDRFYLDLDDAFFRRCVSLGFNVIRLGLTWEDLEPEKGQINESFLRSVDEIFDKAAAYGVFLFLDMHQDLWSSFGNGIGDGAPLWASITDGARPKPAKFVWAEGYFWGKAVHRAFDHFWANTPVLGKGVQDHFADIWQLLARRYGDHPALLGYDLLNEPFPGSPGGKVFRKLILRAVRVVVFSPSFHRIQALGDLTHKDRRDHLLDHLTGDILRKVTKAGEKLIRSFDTEQYSPFVDRMTGAIREVTDKGILMMENCYYSNLGIPYSAHKARRGIGGPEDNNVCFAPHAYDFTVDTPAYDFANAGRVGEMFAEHRRSQERLDLPVIVGEWGGGGDGERWLPHITFLLNLFDRNAWGHTYWAYQPDFFDRPLMRVLVRPYPTAVNGTIDAFSYDSETGVFEMTYTTPPVADAAVPTLVYLHRTPKSVAADGTYSLEPIYGSEARTLSITAGAGTHAVRAEL